MNVNDRIRAFTNVLNTFDFVECYSLYFEKVKKELVTYSSVEEVIQNNQHWMGISLDITTKYSEKLNYKFSLSNEEKLAYIFEQISKLIEKRISFCEVEMLNLIDSNFDFNSDYSVKLSNIFKVYSECIRDITRLEPEVKMEIELIEREYANFTNTEKVEILCQNIIALSGQAKIELDGRQYHGAKRHKLVMNIDELNINEMISLAEKTSKQLNANLNSIEVESGIYPVVFASGEGSFLIHEIIGHLLEADNATRLQNIQIGSRLTDTKLCIFDQKDILASDKSQLHNVGINLEPRRKHIVDNGILKNLIDEGGAYNSYHRSSYVHDAIPRMSCIYVQSGISSPEEIISSVDDGYYVVDFMYGNLNPITLDFRLKSSEAYRIRNGKITESVNDLILEGNALKVLENLVLIADDLNFYTIKCSKRGQVIWTEAGQPTLKINEITVY